MKLSKYFLFLNRRTSFTQNVLSGETLIFYSKCYFNLIIALDVKDYLELSQNGIHKESKNTIRTLSVYSTSNTDMLLADPGIPLHLEFASQGDTFNKNSDGRP